jgi:hypothetical protein
MYGATKHDFAVGVGLDSPINTWYIIHQSNFASVVRRVTAATWGSARTVIRGFARSCPGGRSGHMLLGSQLRMFARNGWARRSKDVS